MIVTESKRLLLREATTSDSAFILKLTNEPAWLEFIGKHSISNLEEAAKYIEEKMISMVQAMGFGLWVVEEKLNPVPIGICGLLKRDSLDCIDLGFAFLKEHWGRGFAQEACIASLVYGENELKTQKIAAISLPSNARSISVLEKVGFDYECEFSHPGSSEVLSLYGKHLESSE